MTPEAEQEEQLREVLRRSTPRVADAAGLATLFRTLGIPQERSQTASQYMFSLEEDVLAALRPPLRDVLVARSDHFGVLLRSVTSGSPVGFETFLPEINGQRTRVERGFLPGADAPTDIIGYGYCWPLYRFDDILITIGLEAFVAGAAVAPRLLGLAALVDADRTEDFLSWLADRCPRKHKLPTVLMPDISRRTRKSAALLGFNVRS